MRRDGVAKWRRGARRVLRHVHATTCKRVGERGGCKIGAQCRGGKDMSREGSRKGMASVSGVGATFYGVDSHFMTPESTL